MSSRSCSPAATQVVGIDNHSKYGKVGKSYDEHPRYTSVEGDARTSS